MANNVPSLWPDDFGEETTLTPVAILREQGMALGERTQNIVLGRVLTQSDQNGFRQVFQLYCPPLAYAVTLLYVYHDIGLYPAHVSVEGDPTTSVVTTPDELKATLKNIFAREKTKKMIASLLAQSKQ
jgi:hypothetical protein